MKFRPLCEHCGQMLRPDVVWFGEQLPAEALEPRVLPAGGKRAIC